MDDKPKLVLLDGETAKQEYALESGEWMVGRSRSSAIKIDDIEASGQHVVVRVKGGEVWVKDNQSKNGTFLNEKPLRGEVSLATGDIIRIGTTCLRFEAPAAADKDFAVPDAPKADAGDGATRFMPASEEPGTRMLDQVPDAAAGGHDDGTSVLPENATRMLDASELKGLQASPKPALDLPKIAGGIFLVLAILIGAFYMMKKPEEAATEDAVAMTTYHDQTTGFELSVPETWSNKGKSGGDLVTFTGEDIEGSRGQIDVISEMKPEYELTGLTMGFEQFIEETKAKHEELNVTGSKLMELNDIRVIFYGYSAKARQGKGIFLIHGDRRIVVEGNSSRAHYAAYADLYSTVLQSFKLYQDQKYFDFPAADETVRRTALANPDNAVRIAKEHFQIGKDLLRKREVQLENLYRSIREFQTSLQYASALSSRPVVYGEAAEELKYALQLFHESVRRQRFEINLAYKQGDRQTTFWEASKLMQMVPDKTDPVYQEANTWVKKLSKKKKR